MADVVPTLIPDNFGKRYTVMLHGRDKLIRVRTPMTADALVAYFASLPADPEVSEYVAIAGVRELPVWKDMRVVELRNLRPEPEVIPDSVPVKLMSGFKNATTLVVPETPPVQTPEAPGSARVAAASAAEASRQLKKAGTQAGKEKTALEVDIAKKDVAIGVLNTQLELLREQLADQSKTFQEGVRQGATDSAEELAQLKAQMEEALGSSTIREQDLSETQRTLAAREIALRDLQQTVFGLQARLDAVQKDSSKCQQTMAAILDRYTRPFRELATVVGLPSLSDTAVAALTVARATSANFDSAYDQLGLGPELKLAELDVRRVMALFQDPRAHVPLVEILVREAFVPLAACVLYSPALAALGHIACEPSPMFDLDAIGRYLRDVAADVAEGAPGALTWPKEGLASFSPGTLPPGSPAAELVTLLTNGAAWTAPPDSLRATADAVIALGGAQLK